MKEKIIYTLKWMAVAPAAILANIVVYALVTILNELTIGLATGTSSSLLDRLFILIAANGTSGFCFVYVASYVAPKHKKRTAIIFTGIMIFLSGILIAFSLMLENLKYIFELIIMTIGAIIAGYYIYKGEVKI